MIFFFARDTYRGMEGALSLSHVEEYMIPYHGFFSRAEVRMLAVRYVLGLLTQGERKSAEPLAHRMSVAPRSFQRLLTQASWDHAGVLQAYRRRMMSLLSGREGILVLGRTVFPKRGSHSVCVARQYIHELGRMVHCQTAADAVFVCGNAAVPWAMDLYVPRFWGRPVDPAYRMRRNRAGMPRHVRHHPLWEMGAEQADMAFRQGLNVSMVTAGSIMGGEASFCDILDDRGRHYIVETPPETEVFPHKPTLREDIPKTRRRGRPRKRSRFVNEGIPPLPVSSLFTGAHRLKPGARESVPDDAADTTVLSYQERVWPAEGYRDGILHRPVWLAARRSPSPGEACRYYLGNCPGEIGARDVSRIEQARRQALACKNLMISDLGLLHHEGRSWTGWHRHVLLVILATGLLLEEKLRFDKAP